MEYILQTKDLTKKYKTTLAVDHVSMNIRKGAIYGFVGRNGAGKTTLIRLITGLVNKTGGEFTLYGTKDSGNINGARRRIAAIVEGPSIQLNMNAYDNLQMQCKILGIVNEKIITDTLQLVGLPVDKNDRKAARNYSLG
jgi:ABC-2 type transport system ATP-binding protein